MDGLEGLTGCTSDVFIEFVESLQLPSLLLLTVAVVFGVIVGISTSTLFYVFLLKPLLLKRKFQGCDAKRLFETDDLDKEDNQSDCISIEKKQCQNTTLNDKERKLPLNSDVAAFALKAKVVYPINQRYRPLADGASNPSLHENTRLPMLPNQMQEDSSSSSLESLSQDNEDDSGQFISSSPMPKAFQNEKFIKVNRFPETLSFTGFDARISLYCLGIQKSEQLETELWQEKNVVFLQVLQILLNAWLRKEVIDNAFHKRCLQMQERELDTLQKHPSLKLSNTEQNEDPDTPYCTLEEMERNGKDKLECQIQMILGFNRQIESLCQHLQSKSSLHSDLVDRMTGSLIENLLLMENLLNESQYSDMRNIQEKVTWWEYTTCTLESKLWLLKQEAVSRLKFTAKVLEHLTSDGELSFHEMERILSDLQCRFKEEVQQATDECAKQTKDLVNEMTKKVDTRRKKLKKIQTKERQRIQHNIQQIIDPKEFIKAYHDLLVKQRKDCCELEDKQDMRITEAVCDLWKKLHFSASQKMVDIVKELFLGALPNQTQLPLDKCDVLRQEASHDLSLHLPTEEAHANHNLEVLNQHLEQEKQTWCEEEALARVTLKHLTEQQQKLLHGTLARQQGPHNGTEELIEMKHLLLLRAVNRQFAARQFRLRVLKEMRLSKLKTLLNETRLEFTKGLETEDCVKQHFNVPKGPSKESVGSEAERRLVQESQLIRLEFQQEFLSELSAAAELIQEHTALVIGHTLAQNARQQAAPQDLQENEHWKHQLTEAATESVYVTRESVSTIIRKYYAQIQNVTEALEQERQQRLQCIGDTHDNIKNQIDLRKCLQKELANWSKKPTSTEFYQRVEIQKKKMLTQYDSDLDSAFEILRQKKSVLDHMEKHLCGKLQEAEETFVAHLAALARASLPGADSLRKDNHSDDEQPLGKKMSSLLNEESSCSLCDSSHQRESSDLPRYEQGFNLDLFEDKKKMKKKGKTESEKIYSDSK
uniref:EvC ciliary complex subunit 1 n=1 Tax=Lepisosteus oculatus TaxID=7918 RepID=W5MV95_LEPOC|nr:PREDICTED: ellis-van Creveld syndrome protein [Lepisosteus oculatus]